MKAAPASMPPTTPRMAAALRRILLLPRRGGLARGGLLLRAGSRGRLLPRSRLACRCGLETSQRRLEVVEDEPHGRRSDRGARLLRPQVGAAKSQVRTCTQAGCAEEDDRGCRREEEDRRAQVRRAEEEEGCVVAPPPSSASSGACSPAPPSSGARPRTASAPTSTSRTARCCR